MGVRGGGGNGDLIMTQFEKVSAEIDSNASKNIDESSDDPLSHNVFNESVKGSSKKLQTLEQSGSHVILLSLRNLQERRSDVS